MSSCYYDAYGRYRCSYLSSGAWAGIVIGILFLVTVIALMSMMRRRRQIAARNAILLQHQQQPSGGQWEGPPPGQGPFGGGGYPMQPNNTGYGGPQPFQPGYTGGYTSPGAPGAPKGYEAYPNTTPGVQEPPRSYNPDQPFHNTTPAPAAPGAYDPPSYSGFSAPSGPPPGVATHGTGASNNPYHNPPDTTKV